jgi:hypothetical protein
MKTETLRTITILLLLFSNACSQFTLAGWRRQAREALSAAAYSQSVSEKCLATSKRWRAMAERWEAMEAPRG